jgi:hypothetical protein
VTKNKTKQPTRRFEAVPLDSVLHMLPADGRCPAVEKTRHKEEPYAVPVVNGTGQPPGKRGPRN